MTRYLLSVVIALAFMFPGTKNPPPEPPQGVRGLDGLRHKPVKVEVEKVPAVKGDTAKFLYSVTVDVCEVNGKVRGFVSAKQAKKGAPPLSPNLIAHVGLWLAGFSLGACDKTEQVPQ